MQAAALHPTLNEISGQTGSHLLNTFPRREIWIDDAGRCQDRDSGSITSALESALKATFPMSCSPRPLRRVSQDRVQQPIYSQCCWDQTIPKMHWHALYCPVSRAKLLVCVINMYLPAFEISLLKFNVV